MGGRVAPVVRVVITAHSQRSTAAAQAVRASPSASWFRSRPGNRGCRDLERLPCCCAPMLPLPAPIWRAGYWPARLRHRPAAAVGARPGTSHPTAERRHGAAAPGLGTLPVLRADPHPAALLVRAGARRRHRSDRHRARCRPDRGRLRADRDGPGHPGCAGTRLAALAAPAPRPRRGPQAHQRARLAFPLRSLTRRSPAWPRDHPSPRPGARATWPPLRPRDQARRRPVQDPQARSVQPAGAPDKDQLLAHAHTALT